MFGKYSRIVNVSGNLFRYDYRSREAQLLAVPTEIDKQLPFSGIDETGYIVMDKGEMSRKQWKDKKVRTEYLEIWSRVLDETAGWGLAG